MTAEHIKARKWRERMGLSYDQLADLSGYSALAIRYFEKGTTPVRTKRHVAGKSNGAPIKWYILQRYRNVCAGVEAQLKSGKKFAW